MAKAITMKGITRSQSKLVVEDGCAEDLINLRFKDGSWRTSGDGKKVYEISGEGVSYSRLFVHTNVYKHLLGYQNGTVYWFADIDNNGLITSRTREVVCSDVSDTDLIYNQTGHLLVVISNRERITLLFDNTTGVYKVQERMTGDNSYKHPIGNVKFAVRDRQLNGENQMIFTKTKAAPGTTIESYNNSKIFAREGYGNILNYLKQENSYHGAFLACVAVELYTGEWGWATPPVLVNPSYCGDVLMKSYGSDQTYYVGGDQSATRTTEIYPGNNTSPVYLVTQSMMHDGITNELGVGTGVYKSRFYIQGYMVDGSPILYPSSNVNAVDLNAQYRWDSETRTAHENVTSVSYNDLPIVGDCYFRPVQYGGGAVIWGNKVQHHLVWGKLNDLYINIDNLNLSQSSIYRSIGVFITPIINGGYDFTDLSFNENTQGIVFHGKLDGNTMMRDTNIGNQYNAGDATDAGGNDVRSLLSTTGNGYYSSWRPKHKFINSDLTSAKNGLKTSTFHLIKSIPIEDLTQHTNEWIKVELDSGILSTLDTQYTLPSDAFDALAFVNAKYGYTYNGRLHLANYRKSSNTVWGINHIFDNDYSDGGFAKRINSSSSGEIKNITGIYSSGHAAETLAKFTNEISSFNLDHYGVFAVNMFSDLINKLDSKAVPVVCEGDPDWGYVNTPYFYISNFIAYPNKKINSIDLYVNREDITDTTSTQSVSKTHIKKTYTPDVQMTYYPIKFYLDLPTQAHDYSSYTHTGLKDPDDITDITIEKGETDVPNGMLVSDFNSPIYFPAENVYTVGNGEIIAMAANAIAVGTGQTGDAPLYVFCSDGVYGLFVDATGALVYKTSRILARDVCNNADSVTPTDEGVIFTTDRGLMCMSGEKVIEIGQPAEGDVQKYNESNWGVPTNVGFNFLTKIASLPNDIVDGVDFLHYLKDGDGVIANYNSNERELYITNPRKYTASDIKPSGKNTGDHVYDYSYVLDRNGNWLRKSFTADEYVNNFPTSYRVCNGKFYKIDAEENQLEGKSEAPNNFLYLSNVVKLDTLDFKEAHRFVIRGSFNTNKIVNGVETPQVLGCYVFGSYDGKKFALLGANEKRGKFTDIGCMVEHTDVKYFRFSMAGYMTGDSRIDYMEIDGKNSVLSDKIR